MTLDHASAAAESSGWHQPRRSQPLHRITALIGSARRFYKTAAMAAAAYAGDSPWFPLDYLLRLARVVVLLSLWRTVLGGSRTVSGISTDAVLTYTLISEVFADILNCRTDLIMALWEGSITSFFLQPTRLVSQVVARTVGRWGFSLVFFSIPLLLASPALGVNPWPASPLAAVAFAVSLVLAAVIGFALEYLFLALIVALDQSPWGIEALRGALAMVLSGAVVPLALMPWGLGDVLAWLPYASMASAPLRLYTATGAPLTLILLQVGWAIILWAIALWAWQANREKLACYGG